MTIIPDAIVEAAARAVFAREYGEVGIGHGFDSRAMDDCRGQARAALSAALPMLIADMMKPNEAVWGALARDIVMWTRMGEHTGATLHKHLKLIGREIPDWLEHEVKDRDYVPPKGTVAVIIFKAMLKAYAAEHEIEIEPETKNPPQPVKAMTGS